jgi:hypothetical protein
MVTLLAGRLAGLSTRDRFTGESDYVFSTELGQRVGEAGIRNVFYAALVRAGLGLAATTSTRTAIRRHRSAFTTCGIRGAPGPSMSGR